MTTVQMLELKLERLNSMVEERMVIDIDANGYSLNKLTNNHGGYCCLTERMSRANMIRVIAAMIEALKLTPVKE